MTLFIAERAGPAPGHASVHDLDLDMEGPGADGEPEDLSGILNPSYLSELIQTYPIQSHTIPYNPLPPRAADS